jgi:hypothetical protein
MARMNTGQKSAKSKNDLKTTYRADKKSVISEIESNSSQLKRMKSQKYENM